MPVAEMSGFQASYARSTPIRAMAARARAAATSGLCLAASGGAARSGTDRRGGGSADSSARVALEEARARNARKRIVGPDIACTLSKRHAVICLRSLPAGTCLALREATSRSWEEVIRARIDCDCHTEPEQGPPGGRPDR